MVEAQSLTRRFAGLSTPNIADACIRVGVDVRCGPAKLQAVAPGMRLAGRVLPVRHVGSVDVFLEAYETARSGDILVVDNGGREDESCVGDLAALEAHGAGLGGIVIWGLHRDTVDLIAIGLPVFSTGAIPTGPLSVGERPAEALVSARVDRWTVDQVDVVFGDEDGVLFVPAERLDEILDVAESIRSTEGAQADRIRAGRSLRDQVRFSEFLAAREADPSLTFRDHLNAVGGAIEV